MVFLQNGFRPFFFAAGLWSVAAMGFWLVQINAATAGLEMTSPLTWHAQSFLIGYVSAVVAGFLLTAVPNWTGSEPLHGVSLGALFLIWIAARISFLIAMSEISGLLDLAFLGLLMAYLSRALIKSNNRRNFVVVGLLGLFGLGIGLTHWVDESVGIRLTLTAVLLLITLIGGRVTPAFTRNWLNARNQSRLPALFSKVDGLAIGTTALALLWWSFGGAPSLGAPLFLLASLLGFIRLIRWRGWAIGSEPLLLMLHLAYLWLPLGYLLLAFAQWELFSESAALHALTTGAAGSMTVAVMMRASLGHSGLPLAASLSSLAIFALVSLAAVLRVFASTTSFGLTLAGVAWLAAFSLFTISYGPLFFKARA